jgi:hypothetical protein
MGLSQFLLGYVINLFYHPSPTRSTEERDAFQSLMSMQFGGWMIWNSKSRDAMGFPKEMTDKLMLQGRIILAVVVFAIAYNAIKALVR